MDGLRLFVLFGILALVTGCATTHGTTRKLSTRERAQLWVESAASSLSEHDTSTAMNDLAKAEEMDSKLASIFFVRGMVYVQRKEFDKAIQSMRRSLELEPKDSSAKNSLGKLLLEQGKYAEADKLLKDAASNELYPEAYKAFTNLGISSYRQSHWVEAGQWFEKAINNSPTNACIAHYYQGHLALKASKFKDAQREYEAATQRFCAGFGEAALALGIAYTHDKQFDRARKTFVDVEKRFPDTALATQALEQLRKLP